MPILRDIAAYILTPERQRGCVLCVGNFDGVHRGHQRMLQTGRDLASAQNLAFVIMTFDPHPAAVLRPHQPRRPISTLEQRLALLSELHPDDILLVRTTPEFLAITPEDFLGRIVRDALGARHMVEGPNFTFGQGARGTIDTLHHSAPQFGFEAHAVETVTQALADLTLVNISSSLIRWLIGQGRVLDAARCLGRPFTIRGQVVRGQQRGRTLGFPTANLVTEQLLPAPGVYAGHATVQTGAGPQTYAAAISIGTNPTFNAEKTTLEAHLLDFPGRGGVPNLVGTTELYGQTLELRFDRWLRDMLRFSGPSPLVAQLQRDLLAVRATTSTR
jgi:riboflavin kinase/FMN adenylyltransferase